MENKSKLLQQLKEYFWIARDKGGGLYLFPEKPIKDNIYGYYEGDNWYKIDSAFLPEVTFENSPVQVELKLVK